MTIYFRNRHLRGGETLAETIADPQPFTFPGGEHHLAIEGWQDFPLEGQRDFDLDWVADLRGADPGELIQVGLWANAARQRWGNPKALIPYFPAARSDRGLPTGGQVYADIVNSFELDKVVILDPHSEFIVDLIKNVVVADVKPLIIRAMMESPTFSIDSLTGIIAPDKGAIGRARDLANLLGLPVVEATKERDFETGKLTGFTCNVPDPDGHYLVVDDICDGGGTFMGLADAAMLPPHQLSLWVTHGIFSGNAKALRNHYRHIFTTDSHPGHNRDQVATTIVPTKTYLSQYL